MARGTSIPEALPFDVEQGLMTDAGRSMALLASERAEARAVAGLIEAGSRAASRA